jgi:hypothetical protein
MQESSLKTNFLGRDGFRWWIGQIPPESAHGGQINGAGWGNRFKVRIMGYHPYDLTELPDEDLPWAQCLLPTTSGTGAGNNVTSVKITPGDVVFGFFLDTDNAQTPVIMGCFGRTSQVLTSNTPGPFQPFTGYTDKVKKPNGTLKPDQSSEQNAESAKSPRNVSPTQAKNIDDDEISYFSAIGDKIQLGNTVNNTMVNKISTEVNNLLNKIKAPAIFTNIKNEINRVTEKIQAITNGLVGNMVNGLFKQLAKILKKGLDLLYKQIFATVLAATQNPAAAHLSGVAAQTAIVPPVSVLQKTIPCVSGAIISGLGSVVKKILMSALDNVDNFVSCAANQFTGALINDVIGKITSGLQSALGGVQTLLKFFPSFSVDGFLRGGIDAIKGLVGMFDCNQSKGKSKGIVEQWVIGQGPSNVPGPDFGKILETANIAKGIGQIPNIETIAPNDQVVLDNFLSSIIIPSAIESDTNTIILPSLSGITTGGFITSGNEIMRVDSFNADTNQVTVKRAYSGIATNYASGSPFNVINTIPTESLTKEVLPSTFDQTYGVFDIFSSATKNPTTAGGCYTGPPTSCGAPTVTIFGGGGSGATAIPLLGAIVGSTGSVIGTKLTNGGSGYDFPPFVEVVDNCNQGYGAVARATINDAGEVDSIYIVSEGENYPIGDVYENSTVTNNLNDIQTGSFVARNYIIESILIQNAGQNYNQTDIAIDQFGNQYSIQVFDGYINKIEPINISGNNNISPIIVSDLPIITIKSDTGSGALLRPILDIVPSEFQGEVKQVIDCVK